MLAEVRKLEALAVERVLNEAKVVCATLTGLDSQLLGQRRYDVVVIDEACQSTEPANWVPLLRSNKLVLAGDHCQLPPTVLSPEAAERGLSVSLMERLVATFGTDVSRLLTVQHRMHAAIMSFSNAEFYEGQLVAHESVASHRLCDLPGVTAEPLTEAPVQFIDTAGASYDEELEEDTGSRRNVQEAALAVKKVRALLAAGVAPSQIGVITPYRAGAVAPRTVARHRRVGDRQRGRLPGAREGSDRPLACPLEQRGRDRLPRGHAAHQHRADAHPPQAARDRRQRYARERPVLPADAHALRGDRRDE